MQIDKQTLAAVKNGILTNNQLKVAIRHYTLLESLLDCHGKEYNLVWRDVKNELERLKGYEITRVKSTIQIKS